jgi:hypothetical protein
MYAKYNMSKTQKNGSAIWGNTGERRDISKGADLRGAGDIVRGRGVGCPRSHPSLLAAAGGKKRA